MSEIDREGPTPTFEDPRLTGAVQEFLAAQERGEAPDREAFLARYPDLAEPLAEALAGVHVLRAVLPGLAGADEETGAAAGEGDRLLAQPLGDFRLLREVGRGGMGVVYEAEQVSLGRRVAVKVLPFAAALDRAQQRRFQLEAQLAAGLHHTNIVPVYAVGCARGVHYFAMQYIEGRSLAEVVRARRWQQEEVAAAAGAATVRGEETRGATPGTSDADQGWYRRVAEWGVQAAEALAHAHKEGIIHRDVKPGNLLVDESGRLWVADFGLARAGEGASSASASGPVGTLRYSSPEQARGRREEIDARSDVYSLGVTLYELLALRPPFGAEDRAELLRQVLEEEAAPPGRWAAGLPQDLETIVLKAVAKAPGERYGSAQEMADDLRRFMDDRAVAARRATVGQRVRRWGRKHRGPLLAAGVTLAVTVAVGLSVGTALLWRAYRELRAQQALTLQAVRDIDAFAEEVLAKEPGTQEQQRVFLERARALVEPLADAAGAGADVRYQGARAHWRVASLEHRQGRSREAEAGFREAARRLAPLVAEFPDRAEYRFQLASYRRILARLASYDPERKGEAEALYRQARTDLERLVAAAPAEASYRERCNEVRCELGQLIYLPDRREEFLAVLRETLKDNLELADRFPDHPLSFMRLVWNYGAVADLEGQLGRLDEAEEAARQGVKWDRHLAELPNQPETVREETRGAPIALGLVLAERGRYAEAEQVLRTVEADLATMAGRFSNIRAYPKHQVPALRFLGHACYLMGRRVEAEAAYRRWQEVSGRLADHVEGKRLHLGALSWCPLVSLRQPERGLALARELGGDEHWGPALLRAGQWQEAAACLERWRDGCRGPEAGKAWYFLALAHAGQGKREAAQGAWDEGERCWREYRGLRLEIEVLRQEARQAVGE